MKKILMLCFLLFATLFVSSCDIIGTNLQSQNNSKTYVVTFLNYDNTLLYTAANVKEGSPAIYAGNTPERPSTSEYTYNFIGWDKDISAIYSDLVVFAKYEAVLIDGGSSKPDSDKNKFDNFGKSMVLNAYNVEEQKEELELYNVGYYEDKYALFYFNLGLIKRSPVYTSVALEYGNQDLNLKLTFNKLTEESLETSIETVVETIDTHSYTGGFNIGFQQDVELSAKKLGTGLKAKFTTTQDTDHHWTNDWGNISTNSESTKNGYVNTYSEGYEITLDVSEDAGFKRGYSYRVSFYETIRCYAVLFYDYDTEEYTLAYENMLVPNQTRLVIEESNDEKGEFDYQIDKTIDFDVNKAIDIANNNMPKKDDSIRIKDVSEFKKYMSGNTAGKTFVLELDTLDLTEVAWVPFDSFTGVLEGNGCRIIGWKYKQVTSGEIGIFKKNNGIIKNLTLVDCSITNENPSVTGTLNVGLLCGINSGTITNVNVERGSISVDVGDATNNVSSYINVGLLCGYNEGEINGNIEITNCDVNAYVTTQLQDSQIKMGFAVGESVNGYIDGINSNLNNFYGRAGAEYDTNLFGACKAHGRPRIYYGNIVGLHTNTIFGSNLTNSSNEFECVLARGCKCSTNKGVYKSEICQ